MKEHVRYVHTMHYDRYVIGLGISETRFHRNRSSGWERDFETADVLNYHI